MASTGYIIGRQTIAPSTTLTNYNYIHMGDGNAGSSSWSVTLGLAESVMPTDGLINFFHMRLTTAPSSGKSWVFTIVVNGVDSAVTVTISDTATEATDNTHSVSFVAGDLVSVKAVPSGTPTSPGTQYWNIGYTPTIPGEQILMSGSGHTTTASATRYKGIDSHSEAWSTTEIPQQIMPTAGVISKLLINQQFASGAAQSVVYTLRKNLAAGNNTVTLAGITDTKLQDSTHTDSVSPGDTVDIQAVASAGIGVGYIVFSCVFVPSATGENIYMHAYSSTMTNSAARYYDAHSSGINNSSSEGNRKQMFPSGELKTYYAYPRNGVNAGSPSPGTYLMKLRVQPNGGSFSDTGIQCTLSAAALASDLSNTYSLSDGDFIEQQSNPSSTPTARQLSTGFVLYIAPAGGAVVSKPDMLMLMGVS